MKVSVIGATGYAGAELLRLLVSHPEAEIIHITSESYTGEKISKIYPHLYEIIDLTLESMESVEKICADSDFVFVCLPAGHAMKIGQAAANTRARIIDLGADYRFQDVKIYEEWYKIPHAHANADRVYGLAELYREKIRNAKIIGNAGCYTTASILALAPLVKNHLVNTKSIIIDAKSGVSGAGRSAKQSNLMPELYDNFKAYGAATHRHTPEIEQALGDMCGETIALQFTPHLLPMSRGILATCYATALENTAPEAIDAAFEKMYGNEFFIRLRGRGTYPETKFVRGSNFCDIGWHFDCRTGRIIVFSAIDNLVKGAAGQAVQNMNIASGIDERTGLMPAPIYP